MGKTRSNNKFTSGIASDPPPPPILNIRWKKSFWNSIQSVLVYQTRRSPLPRGFRLLGILYEKEYSTQMTLTYLDFSIGFILIHRIWAWLKKKWKKLTWPWLWMTFNLKKKQINKNSNKQTKQTQTQNNKHKNRETNTPFVPRRKPLENKFSPVFPRGVSKWPPKCHFIPL